MKFNSFFKGALVLILFLTMIVPVYASSTQSVLEQKILQSQQEQNQLQRTINARNAQLAEFQSEERRLLNRLNDLERNLTANKRELERLEQSIAETEEYIAITEKELEDAEKEVQKRDEFLKMRLRAIYERGETVYLEVLFQTASFAEFSSRLNDLKLVAENDFLILEEAYAERVAIQEKKEGLEKERENLLELKVERLKNQDIISKQVAEQEILMDEVQGAIEAQERAIRELEQEAGKVEKLIKQLQEEMRQLTNQFTTTGKLLWPLADYGRSAITSDYGYRTHPITKKPSVFHGGIDIGISRTRWPGSSTYNGNPVNIRAADDGIVLFAGVNSGYGNMVIVSHGRGPDGKEITTVYAHCHSFLVSAGQQVSRGQSLAIVGSTGSSTGPHVHFEVRIDGERTNPLGYL